MTSLKIYFPSKSQGTVFRLNACFEAKKKITHHLVSTEGDRKRPMYLFKNSVRKMINIFLHKNFFQKNMTSDDELNQSLNSFLKQRNLSIDTFDL